MCVPSISRRKDSEALAQDLPQELLGEIFVRCLPKNVFDHLQPSSILPPLVLCNVCRSWRKAALGTPQLWTELSMTLGRVSTGRCHILPKMLEFWGSHMGALLPSLHFRREGSLSFTDDEGLHKSASVRSFFQSPVVLNAQSLTLHGFSNLDVMTIFGDISFNNLEYLAISQLFSTAKRTASPRFSSCPSIRRLHIKFHASGAELSRTFVTAFSWITITHLSANLALGRQDWCAILSQCVNMTSCSVLLHFLVVPATNSSDRLQATFHNKLRILNVMGGTEEISSIFDGFVFPSLVALRLSCVSRKTTLKEINQAITATPALKELHLQFCTWFLDIADFLRQPQESHLTGPLSKFAPELVILTFDSITCAIQNLTTRGIEALLHSSWLNDGWVSLSPTSMSVEFIFDKGPNVPVPSLVEALNREIDHCGSLPFHASARYVPDGLWKWEELNARELCDGWDDILAFSLYSKLN